MESGWSGGHSLDPLESAAAEEISGGCPLADQMTLEHVATGARDNAEQFGPVSAEQLAAAEECEVRLDPQCPVEGMVIDPRDHAHPRRRIIIVRPRRNRLRLVLAILHELAHVLLARVDAPHSHADVWCLTLALALPLGLLRRLRRDPQTTVEGLSRRASIPAWAIRIRLRMGAVVVAA